MPSNSVGTHLQRVMGVLDLLPARGEGFTARQLYDARPWKVDHRTLLRDLGVLEELELAQRRAPKRDSLADAVSERWFRVAAKHPERTRISTERAIALSLLERLSRSLLPARVVKALQGEFEEARRHLTLQRKLDTRTRWTDKVEVVPDTFTRRPIDVAEAVLLGLQKALLADVQISARYRSRARGVGRKRKLEPRGLVQLGPTLFLIATRPDRPDHQPGWYAAHRFVSVRRLKTRCTGPEFHLRDYLEKGGAHFGASGPPIAFKAWVNTDLKRALLESPLSPDMKVRAAKGGAVVSATIRRSWPFQRWVLSRGPDLRVIEPADLRDYMVAKLSEARAAYR